MFELSRYNGIETPVRRLFDAVVSDPFFRGWAAENDAEGNLAIDISEKDDQTIVRASLPGYRKEDVDIQFHNDVLTISARHSEVSEDKAENYLRRERRVQSFTRSVRLPKIDRNGDIKADLTEGVLTVRLPHSESSRPKQISVS